MKEEMQMVLSCQQMTKLEQQPSHVSGEAAEGPEGFCWQYQGASPV